jgi:hypothetical protein
MYRRNDISDEAAFEREVSQQGGSRVFFAGRTLAIYEQLSDEGKRAVRNFVATLESDDFVEDRPVPMAERYMARNLAGGVFVVYERAPSPGPPGYRIAAISSHGSQLWRMSQSK